MANEIKFLVCTRCFTYNHAPYITDALKGFSMQETSFPVVYCIVDDASTDGTQQIIQDYLDNNFKTNVPDSYLTEDNKDYQLIFAQHNNNNSCFFAVLFLKYNHFRKKSKDNYIERWSKVSKYQAYCEGDDFWINPQKLEKQIFYLENHPNCSAVFADVIFRDERKTPIKEYRRLYSKNQFFMSDVIRGTLFMLNCICMRTEVRDRLSEIKNVKANGDFKLSFIAAKYGYVYKFNDVFSVYRMTGKGLSSQWTMKEQLVHSIREWYDFNRQLDFPDKSSMAIMQTIAINEYLYVTRFRDFPYSTIKDCLLPEKWYIYIGWSISFFIKMVFRTPKILYSKIRKQ